MGGPLSIAFQGAARTVTGRIGAGVHVQSRSEEFDRWN